MGSITRTLANNITTGGVILPSGINNTSISNVTSLPAGVGGRVLQVVSTSSTANTSTSSTSFQASGFATSITPSSTSNKILVMIQTGSLERAGGDSYIETALYKNGSVLKKISADSHDSAWSDQGTRAFHYLDSPNTTSSTSYDLYFKSGGSGATVYLNESAYGTLSITLMEIAG